MRVALCFYGQPRFIDNKIGYESHNEHIISKVDTDIYTHFWFDREQTTFNTSDWALKHNSYIHPDSPKLISDLYAPKKAVYEKPRDIFDYSDFESTVKHFKYYSPNNFKNLQSHLYSFEKTLDLVRSSNVTYDYVIMSRFDNRILAIPELNTLSKDKVFINNMCGGNGHFADAIIMLDFKLVNYFKPYTQFLDITPRVCMFTAEEYKKHSFLLHKSIDNFSYVNILAKILRSKTDVIGE